MSEANGQVLDYDVVVIGAGPAGENVAGRCADHGMSTAIVERELVGGECSYLSLIHISCAATPQAVTRRRRHPL